VWFDIALASNVTVVSSTQLTASTPAHAAGIVGGVIILNPDNRGGSLPWGFLYGSGPAIFTVSPHTGPTAGGTKVTVTGINFVSGATLTLGGVPATGVTVSGSDTIMGTTGPHAAGIVNVVVTDPGSQPATLPNAFTYQ
jgi:hypothetical protein